MKLTSMTDFVLEQMKEVILDGTGVVCARMGNYANFLKQPLTLGMFVPCDEEGNVLEEPDSIGVGNDFYYERALDEYQQAKERVLFEGFELDYKSKYSTIVYNSEKETEVCFRTLDKQKFTIEFLLSKNFDLTLTETAIKQIGL